MAIGDSGGVVDYSVQGIEIYVQCFDGDPANLNEVKGVCHSQFYDSIEKNLEGVNAVDYCMNEKEVVDFGCDENLGCMEVFSTCSDGLVCDDGRCVPEGNVFEDLFGRIFDDLRI